MGGRFGPPDLSDEYPTDIPCPGTSRRPQNSLSGQISVGYATFTLFSVYGIGNMYEYFWMFLADFGLTLI